MGYRVDYGQSGTAIVSDKYSSLRILVMSIAFFLAFCMLANVFWPRGREAFWNILFPGLGAEAEAAVEVFIDELHQGESVSYALENLRRKLFSYAHLS